MGTNEAVVIYSVVIEQAVKGSRSLIDGIYMRVTVTWAQTINGAELAVPVVLCLECPPSWTSRPPCLLISLRCSSVPYASTMSCPRSCNARAGTWSARAAVPNYRAARRVAAPSATYATSQWKKWPVMWCSPANTPTLAAQSPLFTLRKQSMKKPVNSGHTPAPVQVHPANGREDWTR